MTQNFQHAKNVVRNYIKEFDSATESELVSVLKKHTTEDYHWRGMHPFYEQYGAEDVVNTFWKPLKKAFSPIQRREDIFFAGANDCDDGKTQWVVNVGNLLGLFDNDWANPTTPLKSPGNLNIHLLEINAITIAASF